MVFAAQSAEQLSEGLMVGCHVMHQLIFRSKASVSHRLWKTAHVLVLPCLVCVQLSQGKADMWLLTQACTMVRMPHHVMLAAEAGPTAQLMRPLADGAP